MCESSRVPRNLTKPTIVISPDVLKDITIDNVVHLESSAVKSVTIVEYRDLSKKVANWTLRDARTNQALVQPKPELIFLDSASEFSGGDRTTLFDAKKDV